MKIKSIFPVALLLLAVTAATLTGHDIKFPPPDDSLSNASLIPSSIKEVFVNNESSKKIKNPDTIQLIVAPDLNELAKN